MPSKPSTLQIELPTAAALAHDRSRPTGAALAMELTGLFLVLPLLVRWRVIAAPRLAVLALVTLGCIGLLWRDPTFDRSRLFSLGRLRGSLGSIALRGLLAAVLIGALVLLLRPSALLAMPIREPWLWLAGLALYPFLSAWPQEVVFRLFFFHRYAPLLGTGGTMLAANAVAFGFLHVIYPNALAPLLSIPAGLLLGLTWRRTGRLGPVWLEHSIYGLLLFTLGLGDFFFDGRT
jgi:membrane protease YdiL (CAAX protease family)